MPASGYNVIASDTLGVLWRAVSGTVDPWTKNVLAAQQADANLQAQGIDPASATADQSVTEFNAAKAQIDSTISQASGPCPGVAANDFFGGLLCSVKKLGTYALLAVAAILGVYLYGQYLAGRGSRAGA